MMDINYELYKVFYYVAISLSFSDASKQLFISQSAVSQSVKVLEKKLGHSDGKDVSGKLASNQGQYGRATDSCTG